MKNESLEDQCARIVSGVRPLTASEKALRIEKLKAEEIESRRRAVISLRSEWNAPKRHALFDVKQGQKGKWAQKLAVLEGMAGKGYLAALVGIRGNGKTQLAVELMKHATRNLRATYYVTAMEFFDDVKSTYIKRESRPSDPVETQRSILKSYRKPRLLVIDEIGKRSDSEWENNMMFEMVNGRYNDMTDTVLIDNRIKQEFIVSVGPSLASRISETGGIIECDWPSFRQ